MIWIRVSKIYIPPGVKLFGQVYPREARDLIQLLFDNGIVSYQKIDTSWGQLSIGRFPSSEIMENLDVLEKLSPDYQTRCKYFNDNDIIQERIYIGPESDYNSHITGITLPEPHFQTLTRHNLESILYPNGKNSYV